MLWMLEQYKQLGEIALCLDNDDAGVKAAKRLTEFLAEPGYEDIRFDRPKEKDWNDELVRACEPEEKMTMEME
jgi:DNA primase